MAVPTNPNIPSLPSGQPADTDQEAEGAGWLRLLIMSLKTLFVTPPPSDNSTTPATTAYVQTAILNAVLPGASLPAQSGNAGKYLQTDGTNVSWQPSGNIIRVALTATAAVGPTNKQYLYDCLGTFPLTFAASATLTNGWSCYVRNIGNSGVVTLTPNGAELIGGMSTYPLNPGDTLLLQCDGVALNVVRIEGVPQLGTPGTEVLTSLTAALAKFNAAVALSTTRNLAIQRGPSNFPYAVITDQNGVVQYTQALSGVAVNTTTDPTITRLSATTALVSWFDSGSVLRAAVLTDTGVAITIGTIANLGALSAFDLFAVSLTAAKVILYYAASSGGVNYQLLTISGTTVTAPGFAGSGSIQPLKIRGVAISTTQAVLVFSETTDGALYALGLTEAAGVLTQNTVRKISLANNAIAGASGDICVISPTRVAVMHGVAVSGVMFTMDITGTGTSMKFAVNRQTPVVAPYYDTGGSGTSGAIRLIAPSANNLVAMSVDTQGYTLNAWPIYVLGNRLVEGPSVEVRSDVGGSNLDPFSVTLVGANALIWYYGLTGFMGSKPVPLSNVQ